MNTELKLKDLDELLPVAMTQAERAEFHRDALQLAVLTGRFSHAVRIILDSGYDPALGGDGDLQFDFSRFPTEFKHSLYAAIYRATAEYLQGYTGTEELLRQKSLEESLPTGIDELTVQLASQRLKKRLVKLEGMDNSIRISIRQDGVVLGPDSYWQNHWCPNYQDVKVGEFLSLVYCEGRYWDTRIPQRIAEVLEVDCSIEEIRYTHADYPPSHMIVLPAHDGHEEPDMKAKVVQIDEDISLPAVVIREDGKIIGHQRTLGNGMCHNYETLAVGDRIIYGIEGGTGTALSSPIISISEVGAYSGKEQANG